MREFGNMKPGTSHGEDKKKPVTSQEAREPLDDVIEEPEQVKVIAECPREKDDIQLYATEKDVHTT